MTQADVPAQIATEIDHATPQELADLRDDVSKLRAHGTAASEIVARIVEAGWTPEFANWYSAQLANGVPDLSAARRPPVAPPALVSSSPRQGTIKIQDSVLARAKQEDTAAMSTMFRQFIPADERIHSVAYLGTKGIWGLGSSCFGCITEKRVATITVGHFGEVIYQDGYLEFINSGIVYQPSRLGLYVLITVAWLFICGWAFFIGAGLDHSQASSGDGGISGVVATYRWVLTCLGILLSLALTPTLVKLFYTRVKCGLVFWVREGMNVYMFTNRSRLNIANKLYRELTDLREGRVKAVRPH